MNYKEAIEIINPLLENNGFRIVESRENYNKYQSQFVTIIICYNHHERSFGVFAGRKDMDLVELYETVYKDFFDIDFQKLEGAFFADKFIIFLKGRGNAFLTGDLNELNDLNEYSSNAAREYDMKLVNGQNMKAADKAWNENKYGDFIKNIQLIDEKYLPESYKLKIKIALGKLS